MHTCPGQCKAGYCLIAIVETICAYIHIILLSDIQDHVVPSIGRAKLFDQCMRALRLMPQFDGLIDLVYAIFMGIQR